MSGRPPIKRWPVAPRPAPGERLSSWLARLASLYETTTSGLLDHCGLAGKRATTLERGLQDTESLLLAARTGLTPAALDAMTFREIAPYAQFLISTKTRFLCPECGASPAIRRKDAALPWSFWCSTHENRLRSPARRILRALLPGGTPDLLDRLARRGSARLGAWAEDRDDSLPSVPDLVQFLTIRHRRMAPPSLDEPPVLPQSAQGDNQVIQRPVARQALLVVVPEYDRVAPLLDKPASPALTELARGSILRNYALAIAIARLADDPAAHAARVIAASDAEGEARVHEALRPWPSALRRQVYTHLQRLRAAGPVLSAGAGTSRRGSSEALSYKLRSAQSHNRAPGVS
ncbi:TniQ family protein [Rhodoblastus acidophilus]|uniref:TniQ family protein n=1 Tax=Candidatus Rhodoblastus alkanivorans TaxID=2954117 RepID=A0ABS9ZC39_9HYPH|nr:TniQ family protein [Candidatus Rhodoblastus alkanivorans]MCI4684951.1 TniQ family protein [Candidatus Rhodoblastus alkanivorans]MDI4643167.1 TniQ family protein [Rhodoblastus acidophilus]